MTTLDFNSVPSDPYANTGTVIYIRTKSSYFATYSSVPNRRAVRNKRAGGKILKKTLNVQDRIDVQGENFLENQ